VIKQKGDTERQTFLRDQSIKDAQDEPKIYISKILSVLKPKIKLVDIGCGTAHIIERLAKRYENALFIGLDISKEMINSAKSNIQGLTNIELIQGDGLELPFISSELDIVINRLADYSPGEVYRILKEGGYFFVYGLGPDADREIVEFFPDRYEEENFFLPEDPANWKNEVTEKVTKYGFCNIVIEDYKSKDYYKDKEEIMDLIEMVPLLKDFDREKYSKNVNEFVEKYREKKGIGITWHYYILKARKL
jgi:ubiquinone/menaquinone biosynthesis C-methylase UbiE